MAFDGNPVFWTDPSGADVTLTGQAAQDWFGALKDDINSRPRKPDSELEFEDDDERDDWIKKKGENSYVWDDDVTGKNDKDLPDNYEYVGKNLSDVHKNHNSNLSFIERIKKSLGVGSSANINYGPYLSAMLGPIINKAFSDQRRAANRFINNLSENNYFSSIDTNLDPLLPKGFYNFTSSLCVNGRTISGSIEYINRNSDVNFITNIKSAGTYTTMFSPLIYKNTFHLNRGSTPNIKVYNLTNNNYSFLKDFIWNRN